MTSRDAVIDRAHGQCEALVGISTDVWTRCFKDPVEVHHMLTRARGGRILDELEETHHLIALCGDHHRLAHGPGGHECGLMLDGYMVRDGSEHYYEGSDSYLQAKYRRVHVR